METIPLLIGALLFIGLGIWRLGSSHEARRRDEDDREWDRNHLAPRSPRDESRPRPGEPGYDPED